MTQSRILKSCRRIALAVIFAAGLAAGPAALAQDHSADHFADHDADQAPAPSTPPAEAIHPTGEPAAPDSPTADEPPALLEGYGNGGFAITTEVPEAQAYFANGLVLVTAFAHGASIAAMAEAVRLDPDCAMCLWGLAYASGPTLNYDKDADERAELRNLVHKAERLASTAGTDRERDLIAAMAKRYRRGDTARRDRDYARATAALAERYPQDDMIAVLAADATLETVREEKSGYEPAGLEAMAFLEPVLARSPDGTAAMHFYIHASEVAGQPGAAEPYADRLAALAPAASHLVHMPSHTFYWVGRYQDAADANLRAVRIDQANATRLGHEGHGGVFELPYHAHNVIFGLGGAMMAEDSRGALTLARPLIEVSQDREDGPPVMQLLAAAGYFAVGRFDDPAAVLALQEPKLPYLQAAWHYARGEAYAYQGDGDGIRTEMEAIPAQIAEGEIEDDSRAPEQLLGITRAVLEGRLAMHEGRFADAADAFRRGAAIEETPDFQIFTDPPAFWYPVRRDLAAALLAGGERESAIREAEATLALRPRDPVTLAIVAQAQPPN